MEPWHEERSNPTETVTVGPDGEHKTSGTLVLAIVFLASFAVYYFANWMWLSDLWEVR